MKRPTIPIKHNPTTKEREEIRHDAKEAWEKWLRSKGVEPGSGGELNPDGSFKNRTRPTIQVKKG